MTVRAIQIFRTGKHVDARGNGVEVDERLLLSVALSYDPDKRSAPLVLGHPENDRPAYGKVLGLVAQDQALFAIANVSEALLGLVRANHYKHVSASFMTPGAPGNPKPASHYLKHVGFLGAVAPAVKGMQALDFSADDFSGGVVSFADCETYHHDTRRLELIQIARDIHRANPRIPLAHAGMAAQNALALARR